MPAKKKSKEYSRGEGAALLRKQWAESKGKPKNLRKVAEWAGTVAINAIPSGRAASAVAKTVSRGRATKITSGEAIEKVRKFKQGKNATIKNTPPKKSGVGPNSPIKGTEVEVTYKTRKISPKQSAWRQTGIKTISKTRENLAAVKAGTAGVYVAGNSAAVNTKQKADKKKSDKKKK